MRPASISVLLAERPRPSPNPVLVACFEQLRRRGLVLHLCFAEQTSAVPEASLVVFKSRSTRWFESAQRIHEEGLPCLDPWPARLLVRDKWACTARLAAHGVPVPRTWLASEHAHVSAALAAGPLVLKPRVGHAGEGVQFLPQGAAPPADVDGLLAQERIGTRAPDTKLSIVGGTVFAARKPFAPGSSRTTGHPFTPSAGHVELARTVSVAVGAQVLGIDVVESEHGPVVVDVNWFPAFRAFPEAASALAELLLEKASRHPR